ncbi:hypothetical protein J2794_006013 [Paraburkholderia terricola]|nr:hypothetical protein [Paraburkholderia terricola]
MTSSKTSHARYGIYSIGHFELEVPRDAKRLGVLVKTFDEHIS